MKYRVAIENLKGCIVSEEWKDGKPTGNVMCDLTREILSMAIDALEKQEPVKPTGIRNYGDKDKVGFCPVCRAGANSYMKYCEECGQRLNWTEDAE